MTQTLPQSSHAHAPIVHITKAEIAAFNWASVAMDASSDATNTALSSQVVDANLLSSITGIHAALGSPNEQFYVEAPAGCGINSGTYTISDLIAKLSKLSSDQLSVANTLVSGVQQRAQYNISVVGNLENAESNQNQSVDATNVSQFIQKLEAVVQFLISCSNINLS